MPRLPIPGADEGVWGDLLNEFLSVEHNADGTQKTLSVVKGGTGATTASGARTSLGVPGLTTDNSFSGNQTFTGTVKGIDAADDDEFVTLGQLDTTASGGYFVQGGNSFGATATLGTNDDNDLVLETNGTERLTISNDGNVGIGTTSPDTQLEIAKSGDPIITLHRLSGGAASGAINFMDSSNAVNWQIGARLVSSNAFEINEGDTANNRFYIASGGNVGIGETNPGAKLHIKGSADDQQLIVQGNSTQTANLLEIQRNDSTIGWSVSGTGILRAVTGSMTLTPLRIGPNAEASVTASSDAAIFVEAASTDRVPLRLRGLASQTADLQQWQDSSGAVLSRIDYAGRHTNPGGGSYLFSSSSPNYRLAAEQSGHIPLVIAGAGTQTADLQQWQHSSGTVLSYIDKDGNFVLNASNSYITFGGTSNGGYFRAGNSDPRGILYSQAATQRLLVLRGHASQSVDLQQWQNSSGTILAAIGADGKLLFGPAGQQDTNLYRSAANTLKTDDEFYAANQIIAFAGNAKEIKIGGVGPGGESGITLQGGDVKLFRSGTNTLTLDGKLLLQNTTDSTEALQVKNTGGDSLLTVNNAGEMTLAGTASLYGGYYDYSGFSSHAGMLLFTDDIDAILPISYGDYGSRHGINLVGDGGASTTADYGIYFGFDTNLYRSAANVLKTDDELRVALDIRSRHGHADEILLTSNGRPEIVLGSLQDTNLYRSSANTLKTDDDFFAKGNLRAKEGVTTNEVIIGTVGPASESAIQFGGDTNLYRNGSNILKTDDSLVVAGSNGISSTAGPVDVYRSATSNIGFSARLNADTLARYAVYADGKVEWGDGTATRDTNLYRSTASTLKTDDEFHAVGRIKANVGTATVVNLGDFGPANEAGIVFGSGNDTNLYRFAANTLKTDDNFLVQTASNSTTALQIQNDAGTSLLTADTTNMRVGLGVVGSFSDSPTKLADPASLPASSSYGTAFSPDGTYMAVAHNTTPFITIYKRSGDTFTKLANPASLPTGDANGVAFSPDGTYMSVAHDTSPYVTIYKRSGDTFTKLSDPASLPTNTGNGVAFSPDSTYMSVVHLTSPFITIYKRSGDTFTKLPDPASLPTNMSFGVAFSPDGVYMSVAFTSIPLIAIYKRSGDTFTKLPDPASLPASACYGTAFSPDGTYVSVAHNAPPYVTIYKRSGDTFTKLPDPSDLPTGVGYGVAFSPDGSYMSVTHFTTPFVTIYKRSGDTFTKLANPASLPAGGRGTAVAFSPDGAYMSVAHDSSPYITIYKGTGTQLLISDSSNGNFGFRGVDYGSGQGVIAIANAATAPTTNPSGGGILYSQSGRLKWRSSDGTIDTIGAAAGTVEFYTTHTWAIAGTVAVPSGDTDYLIPMFASEGASETVVVDKVRYRINSGTSVTFKLQNNGSDITGFTGLSATTTSTTTDAADQGITDLDMLVPVVTAVSGTPKNMTITVFLKHTVTVS